MAVSLRGIGHSMSRGLEVARDAVRRRLSAVCVGLAALLAVAVLLVPATRPAEVHADTPPLPPLLRSDFSRASEQGFGDRNNSWPWAMKWWQGHLYVGTNRAASCIADWELHKGWPRIFPYPADDPTQNCKDYPTPADLPMAAEIWRWTPGQQDRLGWTKVYTSPQDVPNPDPQYAGKKVPREYGFRTAEVFTEPGGQQALYFGGVHTRPMWDWDAADNFPPPRLLRTTDGTTFTPVPHDDGTFLGELPSNSFRGLTTYENPQGVKRLFAIHGSILGSGFLMASENPAAGNDAWRRVSPAPVEFWDLEVFNGWLYGLAVNYEGRWSYTVVKTQANTEPYQFVEVVPSGGYLTEKPAQYALSMAVHDGRLYVGAVEPSEVLRINPDDTWELVAGAPRLNPKTNTMLYPTSGLDEGFNNGFNDHIWRMQGSDGQLYVGTYDASIQYRFYPRIVEAAKHLFGADLYRTRDGWYVTPITLDGFGDPFAIGIRNFADTPHGLFAGLADDSYGLWIWRGIHGASTPSVRAPGRLEVESVGGNNVLAWEPSPNAAKYHVIAAPMQTIKVPRPIIKPGTRTPTSAGTASSASGAAPPLPPGRTAVPAGDGLAVAPPSGTTESSSVLDLLLVDVRIPGPYRGIASTPNTFAVHPSIGQTSYLYMVVAEDANGNRSEGSNLVLGPSLNPPMTFARVAAALATLVQRGRMAPLAALTAGQALGRARTAVAAGNHTAALDELRALRQAVLDGTIVVPAPERTDLEVLVWKLMVRATWVRYGVIPPSTPE